MIDTKIAPCRPTDVSKLTWVAPGFKALPPTADDTVLACEDCQTPVWASPGKVQASKVEGVKVVCWPCAEPYMTQADLMITASTGSGNPDHQLDPSDRAIHGAGCDCPDR